MIVMALVCHALGRGTVRCRADARRRWSGGVRGPGSGGRGWRALGCAQCLRGRGEGAAASRPCIAGFPPVSVGVRAAPARADSGLRRSRCAWRVSTAECVLRHGVKTVRSQTVQLSFRAAPLLRRGTSRCLCRWECCIRAAWARVAPGCSGVGLVTRMWRDGAEQGSVTKPVFQ